MVYRRYEKKILSLVLAGTLSLTTCMGYSQPQYLAPLTTVQSEFYEQIAVYKVFELLEEAASQQRPSLKPLFEQLRELRNAFSGEGESHEWYFYADKTTPLIIVGDRIYSMTSIVGEKVDSYIGVTNEMKWALSPNDLKSGNHFYRYDVTRNHQKKALDVIRKKALPLNPSDLRVEAEEGEGEEVPFTRPAYNDGHDEFYSQFGRDENGRVLGIFFSDFDGTLIGKPTKEKQHHNIKESPVYEEMIKTIEKGYAWVGISGNKYDYAFNAVIKPILELHPELADKVMLAADGGASLARFRVNDQGEVEIIKEETYSEIGNNGEKTYISNELKDKLMDWGKKAVSEYREYVVQQNDLPEEQRDEGIRNVFKQVPAHVLIGLLDTQGMLVRGEFDKGAAQAALIGIPFEERNRYIEEARKIAPHLGLRTGGAMTIEMNAEGLDKSTVINYILNRTGITADHSFYLGDDFKTTGNDFPVKKVKGLNVIACDEAKKDSDDSKLAPGTHWIGGNEAGTAAFLRMFNALIAENYIPSSATLALGEILNTLSDEEQRGQKEILQRLQSGFELLLEQSTTIHTLPRKAIRAIRSRSV